MDFEKLIPGRDLDCLIAEKVMGYQVNKDAFGSRVNSSYHWVPLQWYSSHLPSAMNVAFAMHGRGYEMEIFVGHVSPGAYCKFQKSVDQRWEHYQREAENREQALAMAISIAALKVVQVEK